ncbi:MAG: hypothetical protein NTU51_01585 [Bacteroidetes bacterium]|nr:hypothetical protein [Bacteroidota bacterium]
MCKNRLLLYFSFIFIGTNFTLGQNKETLDSCTVVSKKVLFLFNGKSYPSTFYFEPYHNDFIIKENYSEIPSDEQLLFEYRYLKGVNIALKVSYKYFSNSIDTLVSFFPLLENPYSVDKNEMHILYEKGLPMYPKIDSIFNLRVEEEYSYILREMNEPILYKNNELNFLRIIYHDRVFTSTDIYKAISIFFYEDTIKLYSTRISTNDNQKFEVLRKHNRILRENEVKKLYRLLNKIDFASERIDCQCEDRKWLIEYSSAGKYYIFLRDYPKKYCKCLSTVESFIQLSKYLTNIENEN